MRSAAARQEDEGNLPKGIQRSRRLPDDALGALWDSIILEEKLKTQLLSQAVLNFTIRGKVDRTILPLHGVILLVGPPGTGTFAHQRPWRVYRFPTNYSDAIWRSRANVRLFVQPDDR